MNKDVKGMLNLGFTGFIRDLQIVVCVVKLTLSLLAASGIYVLFIWRF